MKWTISDEANRRIGLGLAFAGIAALAMTLGLRSLPTQAEFRAAAAFQEGRYAAMTITQPTEVDSLVVDFRRFGCA